ncbi:Cellulose synthase catalytic subunit [Rhodospirillaceae bacterium LM-1]|nr:Cellulose synthase catalytic subunit [Rhodospirillaceae bacterium LM-1]
MRFSGVIVLTLIVIVNLAAWAWLNRPHSGVDWQGQIRSVSFSPFQKDDDPQKGRYPSLTDVERDLKLLAGKVAMVRTYTALDGLEQVPELAQRFGLKVLAGAWIDTRLGRNEAEIRSLIGQIRNYKNVERVIVGNEALHRGDVTVPQLVRYIRRVKERVKVPVSTAEPWYVWIKYPELAKEVDYISIHILPYWEGVPVEESNDYLLKRYEEVKAAFPGKHVMITEVGWPSSGKMRGGAEPSLVNQALFLRKFLKRASETFIDYNVIEAFDQPWKNEIEWSVGAHWGMFDADRHQKFPMEGPVVEIKEWPMLAAGATAIGFLPLVWFLWRRSQIKLGGRIFFAAMTMTAASVVMWAATIPVLKDFAPGPEVMWTMLVPGQIALLFVILISTFEFTELTWSEKFRRHFKPHDPDQARAGVLPKVSLHLPCYNEPPQMVMMTIDSLMKLDYPDFEILIIDNNTKDPAVWQPVEEYCATLGPKVRFFHLPQWPGYKAGALNFALSQTDPEAQIIGVIDSDYLVEPNWLKSLTPYFDDEKVAWVQAPQDHREWEHDTFKEMINWEYAGFFHIGMVARNEYDAIIQHGTMTLIRKEALEKCGKWGEGYICEDAELGLKFLETGYHSIYVNHCFGKGLTPDTFMGYKKQRYRWAYGAMQILKGHWRTLLPWAKGNLSFGQKFQFVAGWLPWIADGLFLVFTAASILWSLGLVTAPRYFDFPLAEFAIPTLFVFFYKLATHLILYQTRVKCSVGQQIGSAVAGMGLTFIIAKAVMHGIFTKSIPFMRTPKMENKAAFWKGILGAWEELALACLQWSAAGAVLYNYGFYDRDAKLWALVLIVQSMPYLAAVITSLLAAVPSQQPALPEPAKA